jgi:hypothetical protein
MVFNGNGIRSQVTLGGIPLGRAAAAAVVTKTTGVKLGRYSTCAYYQQCQYDEKMPHSMNIVELSVSKVIVLIP